MNREPFKTFTGLIAKINRNIRRIKTEVMAEYDLKCPHVSVLYYLYTDGPLTAKQLCEVCEEDKGAVSRTLESLEQHGFIENVSKTKKYKSPLKLTKIGMEVGGQVSKKIDDVIDSISSGLTEEDRNNLYDGLGIILTNMEKVVVPSKNEK